jgi:hypothetical protein
MTAIDFPATRHIVGLLDSWLARLAVTLGEPVRIGQVPNHHYEFSSQSVQVVEIAKAVRIASALNACLYLADAGFVTEVATPLRSVEDFVQELTFLAEPGLGGPETAAHKKFVADFFEPLPKTVEELNASGKKQWVPRSEIDKARMRIADAAENVSGDELVSHGRVLALQQNAYVHGGYLQSMDLWDPGQRRFLTAGHVSPQHFVVVKQNIALHVFRVIIVFFLLAKARDLRELEAEIYTAFKSFEASPEYQAIIS